MQDLPSYEQAASQLLRAIRAHRSQTALARRLGYRSNPITDWEHGRRFPTAPETLRLLARLRIDVEPAFGPFLPAPPPTSGSGWVIGPWLDSLRGRTSIADLARRAQCSRFSASRWLSGQSTPRLPEFLRLLDATTGRACEWVANLVPIEQVPCLAPAFERVVAARRLAIDVPWSEAVMRVLETTAYEHCTVDTVSYVAGVLALEQTVVRDALDALLHSGLVVQHESRYRVAAPLLVDTKTPPAEARKIRAHWATVARDRIITGDQDWFAYNVFSASRSDCALIEQKLRAVYREIRSLIRESEPNETAALLTLQLTRWPADGSSAAPPRAR